MQAEGAGYRLPSPNNWPPTVTAIEGHINKDILAFSAALIAKIIDFVNPPQHAPHRHRPIAAFLPAAHNRDLGDRCG